MATQFDQTDLVQALKECGIQDGDVALVSSDISLLGTVTGTTTLRDRLECYFLAVKTSVGAEGTIVAPAFYYEYARKHKAFDIKRSPISRELGLFPRYLMAKPGALRSLNPISSLVAVGPKAKYICGGETGSAFGVDSPFDRLYRANGKMIFLGVDLRVMTFMHYVEHMVGVPHVYNKYYQLPVFDDGKRIELPISAQVRYLDLDVSYSSLQNTDKLERAGIVRKARVGTGFVRVLRCDETFDFLKLKLQRNFFYILESGPKFREGQVPVI